MGLGADRHEGRARSHARARELARPRPPRPRARHRPALLHARGAAGRREPAARRSSPPVPSCARRISPSCSSPRTTRSRPAASATSMQRSRSAESAPTRPGPGSASNAIGVAVDGLHPLTRIPPEPVDVEGLTFIEVLSVTRIEGGIADNVIPDRVDCRLNYRFAPSRTLDEAVQRLAELVGGTGELEITSNSPPGPCLGHLAARPPPPRDGWLPRRAEAGVDACRAVHRGGRRRRQPRARGDRVRAQARRAGLDPRARAHVRGAATVHHRDGEP